MESDESFELEFDPNLGEFLVERLRMYIASPLTNEDDNERRLNAEIRREAKRICRAYFTVYDPADYTAPGSDHSAEEVFIEDHTRTRTADVVLFHVNSPSLGVGIESQIAAEATIPRIIAYQAKTRVSRMFRGLFSPVIADIAYVDAADFARQLQERLPSILRKVKESANLRRPISALIAKGRLGHEIFKARILSRIPIRKLAQDSGIRVFMLRKVERDDDKAECLTLIQVQRLAASLKVMFVINDKIPSFHGDDALSENQQASLESLVSWARGQARWIPDERIFAMWRWYSSSPERGEHRKAAREDRPMVSEEWDARYSKEFPALLENDSAEWSVEDQDDEENEGDGGALVSE